MRKMVKLSLALISVMLLVTACGTTTEAPQEPPPPVEPAGQPEAVETPAVETPPPVVETPPDPNAELLAKTVVYFDFDSSVVHDESMPMLRAHAENMVANGQSVTLEGHADERGTREYNIALGERRADAVRRILMANGVAANQIRVVSYGEERPAALGHDEESWAQNRRTELVF